MSSNIATKYTIYHWWKGDYASDPRWVHSDTYLSPQRAREEIKQLKSFGFDEVRVIKSESCELNVEQFLSEGEKSE